MTGAKLRLLLILCAQDITDTVEQLKIRLARVRRQTIMIHVSPGKRSKGLVSNCIPVFLSCNFFCPLYTDGLTYAVMKEKVMAPVIPKLASFVSAEVWLSLHL